MNTKEKHADEHYDRRRKESDETFCASCGAIIKKEAEICPKCGVKNKTKIVEDDKSDNQKPKGSVGWLIFWIIIFWPVAIWYGITRRFK